MKKSNILFGVAILATALFTTCEKDNLTDEGVVINGVKWATRNVDKSGKFAATPESDGKLFQWNRSKAWDNSSTSLIWNINYESSTTWKAKNDPCPKGWRVPTYEDLETLFDNNVSSEWTTQNGVKGNLFTDFDTGNSIFLPAAGKRTYSPDDVGIVGYYWSSNGNFLANYLYFDIYDTEVYVANKGFAFSVRCVSK